MPDDTVSIIIGGDAFTGWKSVRISRSLEKMPPDFDIIATERNPDTGDLAVLPPASPCQIRIGDDLVLTGYVDQYLPSISPDNHDVRITGRGKCEDLVDCSITTDIINGMQIATSSLMDLATRICAKFGDPTPITVKSPSGNAFPVTAINSGAPLVFNANLLETPYEILEKVARYAAALLYEDTDGNLVLGAVGDGGTMASGFVQGVNVQAASAVFAMNERFSIYRPMLMATNQFGQQGIGGTVFPPVFDEGVPRFRPLIVVSEQFQSGQSLAEQLAQWQLARRWGRSNALRVTCDSWRDKAGRLWAPNAFAPIDVSALKLGALKDPWIIGSIDFIRSADRGTVADLLLMPKEAFTPEPIILVPWLYNPNDGAVPPGGGGANKSFSGEGSVDNPQADSSTPTAPPAPPVLPAGGGASPPGAPVSPAAPVVPGAIPGPESDPNAVMSAGT